MGTQFSKDMNIITNFLKDMDIIAKLDDQPNDVGGMTAAELKAKFDEGGKAIQEYINGTLIPEVIGLDATEESRKEAEEARASAEASRAQAEEARASAEASRAQAEEARVSAEQGRAVAEEARADAEEGRASAERQRVEAERQRADETAGIVARATEQAQAAAQSAAASAGSEAAVRQSAVAAQSGAASAAASAESARSDAASAKSWAVGGTGTRPGEDADNAKYWASQAHAASGGGVTTFNGRFGAVTPQPGDYTAGMVGAVSPKVPSVAGNLAALSAAGELQDSGKQPSDFAPSGYGLGDKIGVTILDDFNNARTNGWYNMGVADGTNAPQFGGVSYGYGVLFVSMASTQTRQDFYAGVITKWPHFVRYYYPGEYEWGPWECVNPPLVPGVEFRTIERWNGKPVYQQMFSFGAMPPGGVKTIATKIAGCVPLAIYGTDSAGNTIPRGNLAYAYASGSEITINTTYDASSDTATVVLKYAKSTD